MLRQLGLQMLLWSASGLYMVAVDLDFIHGDFLVRSSPALRGDHTRLVLISSLLESSDDIRSIKLNTLNGLENPVYEVTRRSQTQLFDAVTGERLSALSRDAIASLARGYYAGDGEITSIQQLESVPVEVRGRPVSMWRVDFDDRWSTSFYLDPNNAALLTRRHRWWRWFDSFWMLHVMDYGYERDERRRRAPRAELGGKLSQTCSKTPTGRPTRSAAASPVICSPASRRSNNSMQRRSNSGDAIQALPSALCT